MINDYTKKKLKNQVVSQYTKKHFSQKMQKRIFECSKWLQFLADGEVKKTKVHQANFCNNRFCPICGKRLAMKDALRIGVMMEYIELEHGKAFIFVSFTAPNVPGDELRDEITKYNKAFKDLLRHKDIAAMNKGCIRKLEITYNAERNDFHPHFHCIFAVNKSYFTDRTYIKQSKWLSLWRQMMQDESITQVDVRRVVRTRDKKIDDMNEHMRKDKAVNELAKYAAKDSDYTLSQEVFDNFYYALKGRQVLTYSGLFAMANRLFKAHELDKYLDIDSTEYQLMLLYRWGKGEYIEKERRELTDEEYSKFNRRLLGENDD